MYYCTVKVSVAVCVIALAPEPELAVTVTVLVPAGVPAFPEGCEEEPPQPSASPPIPSISARQKNCGAHFLLRKKSRPIARTVPPPVNGQGLLFLLVDAAVVVMVIVVLATAVPFGVTVAGAKLQAASLGRPEQAKLTGALKPLSGVTDRPTVPLLPGMTERLDNWAASVKVGAAFTVSVTAEETEDAKFVSPEYCAVIECVPTLNMLVE